MGVFCLFGPDVNYQITIKTGSINGASSDSKVFVKMYGEKGDTCKMLLMVSENDLSNYYETGRTDIFTVDTFDIGTVWGFNRNIKNCSDSEPCQGQSLWRTGQKDQADYNTNLKH